MTNTAWYALSSLSLIDTTSVQLETKKQTLTERIETLTKTRTILNSKKKRQKPLYDALATVDYLWEVPRLYAEGEPGIEEDYRRYLEAERKLEGTDREALHLEKEEVYRKLADVNAEIREARSELRLCEQILKETPVIQEKLREENRDHPDHSKLR